MPSLLSNVTWVHQVMDVVEQALIDERVEVRSKASQVLGGLLHCAFVDKERQDTLLVSRILPLPQGCRNPLTRPPRPPPPPPLRKFQEFSVTQILRETNFY